MHKNYEQFFTQRIEKSFYFEMLLVKKNVHKFIGEILELLKLLNEAMVSIIKQILFICASHKNTLKKIRKDFCDYILNQLYICFSKVWIFSHQYISWKENLQENNLIQDDPISFKIWEIILF